MPQIYKPEENPILKFYNNKIVLSSELMKQWQQTQNTDYGYYINEFNSSGNIKIGTTGGSGSSGQFKYGYLSMNDNGQFSLLGSPNYQLSTASSQNVIFNPLVLDKETIITRIGNRDGVTEEAGEFNLNNAYPMVNNIVKNLSNTEIIDLIRNDENIILNYDENDIGTFYNNEVMPRTALKYASTPTIYLPLIEYEVTNIHANGANLLFPTGGGIKFYVNPFQKLHSSGTYNTSNVYSSQTLKVNTGTSARRIQGWNEKNNDYKVNVRSIYPMASGAITENLTFNDFIPIVIKHTNSSSRDSFKFVIVKKSSFEYLLNLIGIPWTYDTTKAINNSIEDFDDGYDPEPSLPVEGGQPDNEAGGGDGDGDNTQDNFELPTPTINPASAAVNQYVLNSQQVFSFMEELFNGTFWTNSDLLNKNPKESVVSLTAWPINLLNWDLNHVGISQLIQCGNVTMEYASGQPIQNGYNKVIDIGEYEIKPYFGSFMDYLTKIEIFLPFIGWRNLSTQNVMGRTIKVKYVLNFEDGGIVVYITSTDGEIERLEQVEQAKLAFDLPIFTSNINEKEKDKLQLLMTAAISAVTAGVGAFGSGAGGVATEAGKAAGKEVVSGASKIAAWQDHINGGSVVASNATWYLPNKCILKFTRPRKSEPSGYGKVNGYPANYTAKLGDVTGYTEVDNPVINGIECTEIERQKIKALLQGGIFL